MFGRESYVLRFESGAEKNRYAQRLHEEALCLSFQRYMNGGGIDPVLRPYAEPMPTPHVHALDGLKQAVRR